VSTPWAKIQQGVVFLPHGADFTPAGSFCQVFFAMLQAYHSLAGRYKF